MSIQEKIPDQLIDTYLQVLNDYGSENFCNYIVSLGTLFHSLKTPAHAYYLNKSDAFLGLYRATDNKDYLLISKGLRRAAHMLYRQYVSINNEQGRNKYFLSAVK